MKTIEDLRKTLSTYKKVGVAMMIQDVISSLLQDQNIEMGSELTRKNLEIIRQGIYAKHRSASQDILLFAMLDNSNVSEQSLQYIERLQSETSQ